MRREILSKTLYPRKLQHDNVKKELPGGTGKLGPALDDVKKEKLGKPQTRGGSRKGYNQNLRSES